jgi:hypothetical protein
MVREKFKVIVINIATFFMLALVLEGMILGALKKPTLIPVFLRKEFREYYRYKDRKIIQVTDCARYDSVLFYLLKPGQCTFENREFEVVNQVNTAGLRDDEESLRFPIAIALGDSYTMGWGVQQDESFPQVIEKMLHMKVLNAGMSSFGTARETLLLERLQTDSVKYIFVQYHGNDFEENDEYTKNGFRLKIRPKSSYDSLRKSIEKREKYFPFKHLYGVSGAVARSISSSDSPPTKAAEAQNFLNIIRHAGLRPDINIIVFKIDDHLKNSDSFVNEMDSLLKTPEFHSLNIRTIRTSHALREDDYFILDDHINARGHEKIADKIREHILSISP